MAQQGIIVDPKGNVGIGTTNPIQPFHIQGATYINGNVGIGTALPLAKLHINGDIQSPALVGQVAYFAQSNAPTGWLKANGATISRSAYSGLYSVIGTTHGVGDDSTTFQIPDLRGEFIRGWADNRTVDTGRVFGSSQMDMFQEHIHQTTYSYGSGTGNGVSIGSAAYYGGYTLNYNQVSSTALTAGVNGAPRTGSETRPRNVALLACIKY